MESSRLGTDDQEHAVQWLRVLDFREEGRVQAKAESDFRRSVEVGLEEGVVEESESSHDHLFVLIAYGFRDHLLQLVIRQDFSGRCRWNEFRFVSWPKGKMGVCKGSVQ